MRLPGRRVVLADPRLAEAELVCPAELLEIPLVPVVEVALRWMRRHGEQSVVHLRLPSFSTRTARSYQSSRGPGGPPPGGLPGSPTRTPDSRAPGRTRVPTRSSVPAMRFP